MALHRARSHRLHSQRVLVVFENEAEIGAPRASCEVKNRRVIQDE
jgi:hypothetical protein